MRRNLVVRSRVLGQHRRDLLGALARLSSGISFDGGGWKARTGEPSGLLSCKATAVWIRRLVWDSARVLVDSERVWTEGLAILCGTH